MSDTKQTSIDNTYSQKKFEQLAMFGKNKGHINTMVSAGRSQYSFRHGSTNTSKLVEPVAIQRIAKLQYINN